LHTSFLTRDPSCIIFRNPSTSVNPLYNPGTLARIYQAWTHASIM